MEVILTILIILVFSRLVGELFERRSMPAVIGEVLVGILLGPMVLGWVSPDMEGFRILVDIGLFFLVFTSGLEFSLTHIKGATKHALPISFMGNNIAFFAGMIMALLLGYNLEVGIFIGAAFSLTALPVALRILGDMGKVKTPFGRTIVTSAIYDDLFSMFLLGLVFSIAQPGNEINITTFLVIALRIFLFLGIIYLISWVLRWRFGLIARYIQHYIRKFRSKEGEFAVIVLFGMALALLAEALGISFILGAFYGGVLIGERVVGERVYRKVKTTFSAVTFGFFAPIFFVYTGLNFYLLPDSGYTYIVLLALAFVLVAIFGKGIGAYIGARLSGIPHRSSLGIGIALNSRGLMELIIATYGLELGIIDRGTFSLLALVSIVTTIISPIMLSRYLRKHGKEVENLEK